MNQTYGAFWIRDWQPGDRQPAYELITGILQDYGLGCGEPTGADRDVLQVEDAYFATGGEFWVVEREGRLVGTAGYYPIARGDRAVEIRKMYLRPEARGRGLGRFLLTTLEEAIAHQGYQHIWIETATVLQEAVRLYERNGYQPSTGVETSRCDRIYVKHLPG